MTTGYHTLRELQEQAVLIVKFGRLSVMRI